MKTLAVLKEGLAGKKVSRVVHCKKRRFDVDKKRFYGDSNKGEIQWRCG